MTTSASPSSPAVTEFRKRNHATGPWLTGLVFTAVIALLGLGLARLPVFESIGPMASAILIAILYRQVAGYPEQIKSGIQFASRWLLRTAIVLYGLKLNVDVIVHQGLFLLLRDMGVVIFAITVIVLIAKWLKADMGLSLLLGIGTGVCGAAAIAAVSPILKAKEEDTAVGVGIIALMGTVFAIAYTILRPFLPLSKVTYGIWSGSSLHELAQVALAAAPAGTSALAVALLAKLGRVLLLVPLCLILLAWMRRKTNAEGAASSIPFPFFLVGFIAMSVFGTYGFARIVPDSVVVGSVIGSATSYLLTMAMVGLGLNVSVKDLREKAARPLVSMAIGSVLLSVAMFVVLYMGW